MKKSRLLSAACAGVCIFLSTTTSAVLVDNGGGLIYDTALDITCAQSDAQSNWVCLLFRGESKAAVLPTLVQGQRVTFSVLR